MSYTIKGGKEGFTVIKNKKTKIKDDAYLEKAKEFSYIFEIL